MTLQGAEEPPLPFEALLVKAAYEPVVKRQIEDAARWAVMFPVTPEERQRAADRQHAEDERIITLMRAHQPEPETTSVCRCGHVGYSTSGYLLHVYDVAVIDHQQRTGCEAR